MVGSLVPKYCGVGITKNDYIMRDDDDDNDYLRLGGYNALRPFEGYKVVLS